MNCRQPTCVCKFGYWLSDDGYKCLPAAQLLQKCDPATVACATYNARCDPTVNECTCNYDMEPSSDGTRCRPRSTEQNSLINEPCRMFLFFSIFFFQFKSPLLGTAEDCYQSMLGQDCINGRCRCAPGYRPKTEEELRIVPTDTRECVELSLNFSFYHAYDERCVAENNAFDNEFIQEALRIASMKSTEAPVIMDASMVAALQSSAPIVRDIINYAEEERDSTGFIVTCTATAVSCLMILAMLGLYCRQIRKDLSS